MPDRRVRRGNVIEAMHFAHLCVERAAHDQPHHQLDAFGACFTDVLHERNARQRFRIADELVLLRIQGLSSGVGWTKDSQE